MSTQPVQPQTPRKLAILIAISAALLVASAALIMFARSDTPQPDPVEDADTSPAFVPAVVEVEEIAEPPVREGVEGPEEEIAEAPSDEPEVSLHDEEQLSEEAVELGYEIEELNAQGAGDKKKKKGKTLKPARLIVVANFGVTDVTVNGLPYPEYFEDEDKEGMVLPAGGPYQVNIIYSGKTKSHTLGFKPYETRYLVAEIPGYAGVSAPPPSTPPPAKPVANKPAEVKQEEKEEKKEEEQAGRVTVYAKPRGEILLDGKPVGQKTPNTIESPDGRHEVQVKYEDGELSEKKVVRVRKGSRIKLFFRQRKDKK